MAKSDATKWIGCTAVSHLLGVSLERVRQLHRAGRLPAAHVTLTGTRLYDPRVVERVRKARAANPPKPGRPAKVEVKS